MTDNEIIKALECCTDSRADCSKCPCFGAEIKEKITCELKMTKNALDLIKRLQADKEALIAGQETLQKALAEKNAEIERLTATIQTMENITKNTFLKKAGFDIDPLAEIKAEAIKEFAERLKKPILSQLGISTYEKGEAFHFCLNEIDNFVKEMVGDAE